jgi:hypothetical protein
MLLSLALTLTAPVAPPVMYLTAPIERIDDDAALPAIAYEGLVARYETAYDAWRVELREAEGLKERRALREREPAKIFRSHFEAIADSGSGRAFVWLIEHASRLEKRKQLPALKEEWYGRLFKSYLGAAWFGDVITMYTKERRDVSAEQIEATLADALERAKGDAHARVLLGLARYRLAGKCNSGLEFYEQLIEEHPKSSLAKVAQSEYDRLTKFGMGAAPPDFKGETIDGEAISLYANRGKVTVVDFWGYW